jgi:hypothetical protein
MEEHTQVNIAGNGFEARVIKSIAVPYSLAASIRIFSSGD